MSQYLSALTTTACAGLLQNTGLALDSATYGPGGWIERYRAIPLVASYREMLPAVTTLNAAGDLNDELAFYLQTCGKFTLPALTDCVPDTFYPNDGRDYIDTNAGIHARDLLDPRIRFAETIDPLTGSPYGREFEWQLGDYEEFPRLTDSLVIHSNSILGNGEVGKFLSHFQVAWTYVQTMNKLIESSVANQNYQSDTDLDKLCTGGIVILSSDLKASGGELAKVGSVFDFKYIEHLGTPQGLARVLINKQLWEIISDELTAQGLDPASVKRTIVGANENRVPVDIQKQCYIAFTNVTGSKLSTIKQKLRVYNNHIATLADLLDLTKVFPKTYSNLRSVHTNNVVSHIFSAGGTSQEYTGLGKDFYAVMPKGQADANAAFKKALQQIKCITEITSEELAKLMNELETEFPLDELMSDDTVEYYTQFLGRGDGVHGTFYLTDLIGSPTHLPHYADRYSKIVEILEDGTGLNNIADAFDKLNKFLNGVYGIPYDDPVDDLNDVYVTVPGYGSYNNYNSGVGDILGAVGQNGNYSGFIEEYMNDYPEQAEILKEAYNTISLHMTDELINLYNAGINYDNTVPLEAAAVALFGQNLHSYAVLTELYGPANVLSQLADETSSAGRAIHATLKEGYNKAKIEQYALSPYMIPPDSQPLNPPKNSVDTSSD